MSYIRNALDDGFIEARQSPTVWIDTTWNENYDIIYDPDEGILYSNSETSFYARRIMYGSCYWQLLFLDHLHDYPTQWDNVYRGFSADIYQYQAFVAVGSITEIYKRLDYFIIDEDKVKAPALIINNSAAHELGHSIAFRDGSHFCEGHISGPGIMWSRSWLCGDPTKIENFRRMSYFWGDHVYILRAGPYI